MSKIYDQHQAAFANVSAYVVTDGSCSVVARIAFKYPKDGSGRLYCYMHVLGIEMERGYATGGGYDKASAACDVALRKLASRKFDEQAQQCSGAAISTMRTFRAAVKDAGASWDRDLRDAGFNVLQAV